MKVKVNWGVIGSGGIARRRTIPEGISRAGNARLMSVYDINEKINFQVAEQYGAIAAGSLDELLGTDIDAVYIASPVYSHLSDVKAVAKAGKHILCEKPLGLSVSEAEAIVRTCDEAGILLGTGFMMRFHTQHQAAKQIIQNGGIGEPVYCRAQLSCWYPLLDNAWRQDPRLGGGGSLIDMGSHCIDLLEMFFGPVIKVGCLINNRIHDYPSEDSAIVSLHFKNGALGTVDSFFCIPDQGSKNVLELYGSKGSILAKGTIGQGSQGTMDYYFENGNSGYDAQQERTSEMSREINPVPVNIYLAEIENFGKAVLSNELPSACNHNGLRNQKIIAACYNSAKTGKIVEID